MATKKTVTKKAILPKETVKKEKKVQPTVELVRYTIKAVISTGKDSFSNIQPEITVQAHNIDEAYAFVKPHIDQLHADFFQKFDKKVTAPAVPNVPATPVQPSQASFIKPAPAAQPKEPEIYNETSVKEEVEKLAASSEWFKKAKSAIESAGDSRALDILKDGFEKSTKASMYEKTVAISFIADIRKEKFS